MIPCWLVERGQPENQRPTIWLTDITEAAPWRYPPWTERAHEAIRYSTKEAAEAVIYARFQRLSVTTAHAVEHVFVPSSLTPVIDPDCPVEHDEMTCDRCGRRHGVVWFAPSDLWNHVMRDGDRGNPDRYSFCCPECFIHLAEEIDGPSTGWLLLPFSDGPVERADQIVLATKLEPLVDQRAAEARVAQLEATHLRVEDGMIVLYLDGKPDTNFGLGVSGEQIIARAVLSAGSEETSDWQESGPGAA